MPLDRELINRVNIEAPAPKEKEWAEKVTSEEFSVYSTKLELICEEAKQAMVNLSSSISGQSADCVVGIYTAAGDLAVAAAGTLLHVQTGVIPVKYILKYYRGNPSVGVADGDMYFCNEPLYGGIHTCDMMNILPIFHEGELVAWAVAACHVPETGASEPAGYVPYAKSRYEEGLKVIPLKVAAGFEFRSDVLEMLANMVRNPHSFDADMRARTAACLKVRERVLEIVREKGTGLVMGVLRKSLEVVEAGVKERVKQLVDGTFRHTFIFDTAGNQPGLRVVHIALTKQGESITIDLSGSSPPTQAYVNTKPHQIRAVMLGDLLQFFFADFPVSSALASSFRIITPANTVVNCPDDSAMCGCLRLCGPLAIGIHACVSKLFYASGLLESVTTPKPIYQGTAHTGGVNNAGAQFSGGASPSNALGNAATPTHDGMDAGQFFFSGFADVLDVEQHELQFPYLFLFRHILKDHSGFGRFRGGATLGEGIIVRGRHPLRVIWEVGAASFPINPGLMGGYSAVLAPLIELRGIDWETLFIERPQDIPYTFHEAAARWTSRASALADQELFLPGDCFLTDAGSSGGWGDVLERDPRLVLADVKKGLTSPWAAREVYWVALDEESLTVDLEATERLRAEERERRKRRGKPYGEFQTEWLRKKPKEELLRYYGPWPWGIGMDGGVPS